MTDNRIYELEKRIVELEKIIQTQQQKIEEICREQKHNMLSETYVKDIDSRDYYRFGGTMLL